MLEGLHPGEDRIHAKAIGAPLRAVAGETVQSVATSDNQEEHRQICSERARDARHIEQRKRGQDRNQFLAEIPPRIGPDDGLRQPVGGAPRRLAQAKHPKRKHEAGKSRCEKGRLPSDEAERCRCGIGKGRVPAAENDPADRKAERPADVQATRVNGQRSGSTLLRKMVGNHRISSRGGARLADADADPRGCKHPETAGEPR